MDKAISLKDRRDNCWRFWLLGCVGGIILPLFLVIPYNFYLQQYQGQQNLLSLHLIVIVLVISAIASIPFVPYRLYEDPNKVTLANVILYFTGFFEMLAILFLVYFTGGAKNSPFVFYFLFIPSVIAIAFEKAKFGLFIVGGMSIIAIIYTVFYFATNAYVNFAASNYYDYEYCAIVVWQVLVIIFMESVYRYKKPGQRNEV